MAQKCTCNERSPCGSGLKKRADEMSHPYELKTTLYCNNMYIANII